MAVAGLAQEFAGGLELLEFVVAKVELESATNFTCVVPSTSHSWAGGCCTFVSRG